MLNRFIDSLSPVAYMLTGIVLAALSILATDHTVSGALLAASICAAGLTAARWSAPDGQRAAS